MHHVKAVIPFLLLACAGAVQAADPIDARKLRRLFSFTAWRVA